MALTQIGEITKGEIIAIDWRGRGSALLALDKGETAVLPSGNLLEERSGIDELVEGMELTVKVVSTRVGRQGGAFHTVSEHIDAAVEMGVIPADQLDRLKVGVKVKGPVKRLGDDGATVQIDGVLAILPPSEFGAMKRSSLRIGVSVSATILRVHDGIVTLTRRTL